MQGSLAKGGLWGERQKKVFPQPWVLHVHLALLGTEIVKLLKPWKVNSGLLRQTPPMEDREFGVVDDGPDLEFPRVAGVPLGFGRGERTGVGGGGAAGDGSVTAMEGRLLGSPTVA